MSLRLKEGAFLLGDAHYSNLRPQLEDFLQDIKSKRLKPTQLILCGDIFDALFGGIPITKEVNQVVIDLINRISYEIEIIYLEGNHDFNLKAIFPNVKIFSISKQPVECEYNNKKILLAHGDKKTSFLYNLYTILVRNKFILFLLNILNNLTNNKIMQELNNYLAKKEDCNDFSGFNKFIKSRLKGIYKCDYFIEGHFHQNKSVKFDDFIYINLASFACNQRYFTVKSSEDLELMEEIYLKGDVYGTS